MINCHHYVLDSLHVNFIGSSPISQSSSEPKPLRLGFNINNSIKNYNPNGSIFYLNYSW